MNQANAIKLFYNEYPSSVHIFMSAMALLIRFSEYAEQRLYY